MHFGQTRHCFSWYIFLYIVILRPILCLCIYQCSVFIFCAPTNRDVPLHPRYWWWVFYPSSTNLFSSYLSHHFNIILTQCFRTIFALYFSRPFSSLVSFLSGSNFHRIMLMSFNAQKARIVSRKSKRMKLTILPLQSCKTVTETLPLLSKTKCNILWQNIRYTNILDSFGDKVIILAFILIRTTNKAR